MRSKTILLIQPSYFVAKLFRKWLGEHRVVWAPKLELAEEALNQRVFDGVITVLDLPDSSGTATFHYIKQLVPHTPVAVVREPNYENVYQAQMTREAAAVICLQDLCEESVLSLLNEITTETTVGVSALAVG